MELKMLALFKFNVILLFECRNEIFAIYENKKEDYWSVLHYRTGYRAYSEIEGNVNNFGEKKEILKKIYEYFNEIDFEKFKIICNKPITLNNMEIIKNEPIIKLEDLFKVESMKVLK